MKRQGSKTPHPAKTGGDTDKEAGVKGLPPKQWCPSKAGAVDADTVPGLEESSGESEPEKDIAQSCNAKSKNKKFRHSRRGGWMQKCKTQTDGESRPATMLIWNANSVIPHVMDLNMYAAKHKPRVMCIGETKLDGGFTDKEVEIPGYQVLRRDDRTLGQAERDKIARDVAP